MRSTRHSQIQQQRRGIESARLDLVLDYGTEHKATDHAAIYRIGKRELKFIEAECPDILWRRYRDTLNKTVPVVSQSGVVVTAMNQYRRIWRMK